MDGHGVSSGYCSCDFCFLGQVALASPPASYEETVTKSPNHVRPKQRATLDRTYPTSGHFLVKLIEVLIEMKTIRISYNSHKKSQLSIPNRNETQKCSH